MDLEEALLALINQPKSVTVDGETVTNHSLAELSQLIDQQRARQNAGKLRFSKLVSTRGCPRSC